jgi:hypothetical protein
MQKFQNYFSGSSLFLVWSGNFIDIVTLDQNHFFQQNLTYTITIKYVNNPYKHPYLKFINSGKADQTCTLFFSEEGHHK